MIAIILFGQLRTLSIEFPDQARQFAQTWALLQGIKEIPWQDRQANLHHIASHTASPNHQTHSSSFKSALLPPWVQCYDLTIPAKCCFCGSIALFSAQNPTNGTPKRERYEVSNS